MKEDLATIRHDLIMSVVEECPGCGGKKSLIPHSCDASTCYWFMCKYCHIVGTQENFFKRVRVRELDAER